MKEVLNISAPQDSLDWLIVAGWGDVAQTKIPADVMRAAEELRMPPRNPKTVSARWLAAKERMAERARERGQVKASSQLHKCEECGEDFMPRSPHNTALCGKRECQRSRERRKRAEATEKRRRERLAREERMAS